MSVQKRELAKMVGYDQSELDSGSRDDEIKGGLQENFVRADIYYKTLNVQSLIESGKYTVGTTYPYNATLEIHAKMVFAFPSSGRRLPGCTRRCT